MAPAMGKLGKGNTSGIFSLQSSKATNVPEMLKSFDVE
jgi:hypothetical protein